MERELQLEKMVKELLQRVEEIEKKVAKTESISESVEQLEKQVSEQKESPDAMNWNWKNGLNAKNADESFTFKLSGRVHNDWYTGDIENGNFNSGTRFRSVWLNMSGTMYNDIEYKFQYDVDRSGPRPATVVGGGTLDDVYRCECRGIQGIDGGI
jgi:hypothetical protein